MKHYPLAQLALLVASLFLLLPQPKAAATELYSAQSILSMADNLQINRLGRKEPASDWSTVKPFPGPVNSSSTETYYYQTFTIPASTIGEQRYVQINVTDPQAAVFVSAYMDAYTPGGSGPNFGLDKNYLGDVAESAGTNPDDPSRYFQIVVPYGHDLVIVANETNTTLGAFSIQVEGFLDTEYDSSFLTYYVASALAYVPPDPTIYELGLEVVNTTSRPIYGFRLTAPDLPRGVTLVNATSPPGTTAPYIDYAISVPVDYSVRLNLRFASESRELPNIMDNFIISPLRAREAPGANGVGFFYPRTSPVSPGVIQVDFPSVAGHVYQIQYSADGVNWSTAIAPVSALTNKFQWLDSGPPATATAPARVRYYRVSDITQ